MPSVCLGRRRFCIVNFKMEYFKETLSLAENKINSQDFLIDSNTIPFGFTNSSVCKISDDIFNIRLVNYYIDKSTRYFHFIENGHVIDNIGIKTVNLFNGKVLMKEIYNVPIFESSVAFGIEDIRLHKTLNGEILFLGTSPCFSSQNHNRVCFGLYDIDKYEIIVNKVYESPFNFSCEKNWVFYNENELIYGWDPIRIYSLGKLPQELEQLKLEFVKTGSYMKKSNYTENQIVAILKSQESGMSVNDICRTHGISQATFFI